MVSGTEISVKSGSDMSRLNNARPFHDSRDVRQGKTLGVGRWFWGFTSIGGLSQSHATDRNVFKTCWVLLFIAGSIMTFWNVKGIVIEWVEGQVSHELHWLSPNHKLVRAATV